MKKNIVLFLFCQNLVFSLFSQSQPLQSAQKNIRFQSYNALALITGEQNAGLGIQSVNGVQWKSFFMGAGLGFDFYGFATTPVFLDIRKTFGQAGNKLFVYGDGGYSIAWPGTTKFMDGSSSFDQKGGFYGDIGVGYLIGFKKSNAMVISLGYTFKSLSDNLVAYPLCAPGILCEPSTERNEYHFNRISIKAGWRF